MFPSTDSSPLDHAAEVPAFLSVVRSALVTLCLGFAVSLVVLNTENLLPERLAVLGPALGRAGGVLRYAIGEKTKKGKKEFYYLRSAPG